MKTTICAQQTVYGKPVSKVPKRFFILRAQRELKPARNSFMK